MSTFDQANVPPDCDRKTAGDFMSIYIEAPGVPGHMFNACTIGQISEFAPWKHEKPGFRIHGRRATIRLEAAFRHVLHDLGRELGMVVSNLIESIHDECLAASDKKFASCLRVICLKYIETVPHRDA